MRLQDYWGFWITVVILRHVMYSGTSFALVSLVTWPWTTVDKRSWNPNVPQRRFDGTYSTNRDIFSSVYKPMDFRYNSNIFPFSYGFIVVFVWVASLGANSLSSNNSYPFVIATAEFRTLIPSPDVAITYRWSLPLEIKRTWVDQFNKSEFHLLVN